MTTEQAEKLSNLSHFIGTTCYYRHPMTKIKLTEGAAHVAGNGGGWLIDAILSYQGQPSVKAESFQCWTLQTDARKKTAILEATDGNYKQIARQVIDYTDFPLAEIKFFVTGGVLMLASEY